VQKKLPFLFILFLLPAVLAFSPIHEPVFEQNFEDIPHNRRLNRDFQVWENGAVLELFLEKSHVNSGENGLRIVAKSANPINQAQDGSVYQALPSSDRNWSGAAGVQFWINNPNQTDILITFNFKELFSEYWAVAEHGTYYLSTQQGIFQQQEILYSNLPIPANFEGLVLIPFESFSVPEWNTAISNGVMDLNRIDSYAFGIRVDNNTPFSIYIDDIIILDQTNFAELKIIGPDRILIPPSGELIETFSAAVINQDKSDTDDSEIQWSIQEQAPEFVTITPDGRLSIPAGTESGIVLLSAAYTTDDYQITREWPVLLYQPGYEEPLVNPPNRVDSAGRLVSYELQTETPRYDAFSAGFDVWAMQNRPLFIVLLMMVVLAFLTILSTSKSKLK
jgi:hypothetical protein